MSNDRNAAAQLTSYANIEHDQARQARAAADALFRPKQPAAPVSVPPVAAADIAAPTPVVPSPTLRVPRVLTVVASTEIERKPAVEPVPVPTPLRAMTIGESDHRRIRALALYGQSVGQIAAEFGVAASVVAPILTQSAPAGQGSTLAWA